MMPKKVRPGIKNPEYSKEGDNLIYSTEHMIQHNEDNWKERIEGKGTKTAEDYDGSLLTKNIKTNEDFTYKPTDAFGKEQFELERDNLPQTSFTTWYMDSLRLKALEENFTSVAPNMYIHPMVSLQVAVIIIQLYDMIRHGLDNAPLMQKSLDEKVMLLNKYCQSIGKQIAITQNENDIDWDNYHKFVDYLQLTKSEVSEAMAGLKLRIPFHKRQKWKGILGRFKETTKSISQKGSEDALFKAEDINLDSEVNKDAVKPQELDKEGDTPVQGREDKAVEGEGESESILEDSEDEGDKPEHTGKGASESPFNIGFTLYSKDSKKSADEDEEEENEVNDDETDIPS